MEKSSMKLSADDPKRISRPPLSTQRLIASEISAVNIPSGIIKTSRLAKPRFKTSFGRSIRNGLPRCCSKKYQTSPVFNGEIPSPANKPIEGDSIFTYEEDPKSFPFSTYPVWQVLISIVNPFDA